MGPKNDVPYREVFSIKCRLNRDLLRESETVISSVPEKSMRCRDVSPVKNVYYKDVRYKEVSLYLKITTGYRQSEIFPGVILFWTIDGL